MRCWLVPFFPPKDLAVQLGLQKESSNIQIYTNANAYAVYMIIHYSDMSIYIYHIIYICVCVLYTCVYIYITGNCKNMNSINKKKQIVQNNVLPSQTCVICSSRTCSIDRRICAVRCSRACQHHPRHLNRKID